MKRKLSKFLAVFLAATLLLQSSVSVYATGDTKQQESSESEATDVMREGDEGISTFSLLPLEERYAYLALNGYSDEELKHMPLDTVLGHLKDAEGNLIDIPDEAEVVWTYFKDDNGNVIQDEYHEIGRDETVDLSHRYWKDYTMELIIGTADQLNADNICYNVRVYVTDTIEENFSYSLKLIQDGYKSRIYPGNTRVSNSFLSEEAGIPVAQVLFETAAHAEGNEYELVIDSEIASTYKDITVDVYPMEKFLNYYQNGAELSGSITEQILNLDYSADGYPATYTEATSAAADNVFCIVYTDVVTGEVVGYHGLTVTVCSEITPFAGTVYAYESGSMKNITDRKSEDSSYGNWKLKLGEGMIFTPSIINGDYYLSRGYAEDGEYYYVLENNDTISKVVAGRYYSLEEAENARDITDEILARDKSEKPYGYLIKNEYRSRNFTVFFRNGSVVPYSVYMYETSNSPGGTGSGSGQIKYDEAPVVGEQDPYFRINGANGYNNIYKVENSYDTTFDTLYGYGYQTVFINDASADLTNLKPTFTLAQNVKAYVGSEQISGESVQDFSDGSVYYAVYVGDNLKNYNVTFAKKENGAKLFVNGPSVREIFLDDYFENRHDILIANIGDTELTGLQVELIDPVHVKLDDYWTVGGSDNDTLGAFSKTAYSYNKKQENLAKIRLLPDGSGDVSGTLKISADGQEAVSIELTGHAGNPQIITESLDEAVKYVPYSYVVATDNMHDWNKVRFSVSEGELPDGLELNEATGEIYGVAQESGEFPITVQAEYSREEFKESYADFVLTVKQNTNENVYLASDNGYILEQPVGTETAAYDYLLTDITDQLFVSSGEFAEFIDFWFNGERLVDGVDYEKESGSTRITIKSQTFNTKARNGINTIAAEFREKKEEEGAFQELRRTAQNFRIYLGESDDSGDNDGSSDDSSESDNNSGSNSSDDRHTADSGSSSDNKGETITNTATSEGTQNQPDGGKGSAEGTWIKNETGWWYQLADGSWPTNTWLQIQENDRTEWYYFDENGYMATGWYLYKNQWYYLNPASDGTKGKMCTGWQFIDGKWYYLNENGGMAANIWIQLPYEGTLDWYYFDEKGEMTVGWLLNKNQWYYLNPVSDGTKGKMYSGWQFIDGRWYYFNEISDGTKGALKTDTWIGDYYVDKNGVWIE